MSVLTLVYLFKVIGQVLQVCYCKSGVMPSNLTSDLHWWNREQNMPISQHFSSTAPIDFKGGSTAKTSCSAFKM